MTTTHLKYLLVSILLLLGLTACDVSGDPTQIGPDGDDPAADGDGSSPDGDGSENVPPDGDDATNPDEGFVTVGSSDGNRDYNDAVDGDSAAPSEDGDEAGGGEDDPGREIVESDIFKVIGNRIYALNSYKGLAIIDFTNPTHLTILGRVPFVGYPKEMFVENGVATVLLTNIQEWDSENENRYRWVSKAMAIDVNDPTSPSLIGEFTMDGSVVDSRQVGDVIYVVATVYPWYDYCNGDSESNSGTFEVMSINVADPQNIHKADELSFEGGGWSVYVDTRRMLIAGNPYYEYGWWDDPDPDGSEITYVDISDPAGDMAERSSFRVEGIVDDRFKMNGNGDTLAIVSNTGWNGNTVFETFNAEDPDHIVRLGRLVVMENETLQATRFTQNRAYIVTYRNTDPLFVVDYAAPETPVNLGNLVIPGWSTHMEIFGTKILGVGIDDQDGWRTKVGLFDVTDPTQPTELSSITLGDGYSWSEANWDWKAFKIYDDLDLVLVPTSGYDRNWTTYVNKLNLIDFKEDHLTLRGFIASDNPIRRGFVAGDYLATLSETELQIANYDNRDEPIVLGRVRLASYVGDIHHCSGALCNSNSGWYYSDTSKFNLFKFENTDTPYWSSLPLESDYYGWGLNGSIISRGKNAYVFSRSWGYWSENAAGEGHWVDESTTRIHGFDLTHPESPVYLGKGEIRQDSDGGWWNMTGGDSMTENKLLLLTGYNYVSGYYNLSLSFWNVANLPEVSQVASFSNLAPLFSFTTFVRENSVWVPTCEPLDDGSDRPLLRCYALEINADDPQNVNLAHKVNIPGHLVGGNDDMTRLYTIDRQFIPGADTSEYGYLPCQINFDILSREGNVARRIRSVPLYQDPYCWFAGYPEVDGDETTPPADGDIVVGESDDPQPAPAPAEEGWDYNYSTMFFSDGNLLKIDAFYHYGMLSPDGCLYESYSTLLIITPISGSDGSEGEPIRLETVGYQSVYEVENGGILVVSTVWHTGYQYTYEYRYVTPLGEVIPLDLPENVTVSSYYSYGGYWGGGWEMDGFVGGYGYYYYNSAGKAGVKVGRDLYLPTGWDGIVKASLDR